MEGKRFINCSNHPSANWCREQREAAEVYGRIEDFPFPEVEPGWDREQICECAERLCKAILEREPEAVMCQGEFTLTYAIVDRLKKEPVKVLAACSRRAAEECRKEDGSIEKRTVFQFVKFREY